jgi:hypothetical protein
VEQRIATLERQVAEREALERERAEAERRAAEPPPPPPARAEPAASPSPLPWIIAAVGVAGVGAGVAFGLVAKGKHEDAVAEPQALEAMELQEGAEDFALGANIALIAGGIVAAGGVAWGIVDLASSSSGPSVGAAFGPRGVLLTGSF